MHYHSALFSLAYSGLQVGSYLPQGKIGQAPWSPIGGECQSMFSNGFPRQEMIGAHVPSQQLIGQNTQPAVESTYVCQLLPDWGSNWCACVPSAAA